MSELAGDLLDIFRLTAIKNNSNQPEIIKEKVLL